MTTMNISLPDELRAFIDRQVAGCGYTSSSEYVRELIRREQDREKLRSLLIEGLSSGPGRVVDTGYLGGLRRRVRDRAALASAQREAVRPRRQSRSR